MRQCALEAIALGALRELQTLDVSAGDNSVEVLEQTRGCENGWRIQCAQESRGSVEEA